MITTLRRAALTALVAALGFVSAGVADAVPLATAGPAPIEGLTVEVVGNLPAFASPSTPYAAVVRAASTSVPVSGASFTIGITSAPLADADALDAFMADPTAVPVRDLQSTPVGGATSMRAGEISVASDVTTSLSIGPGGLGLDAGSAGVYGIVVQLRVGSTVAWSTASPVTWQPDLLPTLGVSVLASISGSNDRVKALLGAASDPRVAIAYDPTALTLGQRLALTRREAYLLPAGNLDVSSTAHAQSPALIAGAVGISQNTTQAPWIAMAAAADDATVVAATHAGAFAVVTVPRWAGDGQAGGAAVATVAPVDDTMPAPLAIPDARLSHALATSAPAAPWATASVYAEAAFASMRGAHTVVVAPGDGWLVDGSRPSRAIKDLLDAPFVTSQSLAALLSEPGRPEVDLPDLVTSEQDAPGADVLAATSMLTTLGTLNTAALGQSDLIALSQRDLLSALSVTHRADVDRRATEFAAAQEHAAQIARAVTVTSGSDVLLVSRSGQLPVTVSNQLDVPVTVRVAVTSRSPILLTRGQPSATIEPNTEQTVMVPIEAVSSGDVNVSVAVRTEDGSTLAVAETLKVRVRAAWGGWLTGIVTAGLVVLLLGGIYRTIRRGRRDTRLAPTEDTPVAGPQESEA